MRFILGAESDLLALHSSQPSSVITEPREHQSVSSAYMLSNFTLQPPITLVPFPPYFVLITSQCVSSERVRTTGTEAGSEKAY